MDRRHFLQLGAAASLAGLAPSAARGQARAAQGRRRMNVLFIAVDDLRPQLGCYGHAQMVSPHLDQLAADGTQFNLAYCQQAVCAPSRASLLSGCRPDTTRVYDLNTPLRTRLPNVATLPQHFREHGYVSLSRGKIYHHGKRDDPEGWSEDPWRPTGEWKGRGYLAPESIAKVEQLTAELGPKEAGGRGPAYEAPDVPDNAYGDGLIADQGIADLERLRDESFFLALGFYKPHLPFNAPKRYWDLYDREAIDLADNPFTPKDAPDFAMHTWGELRAYVGMPAQGDLSEEEQRALIHGYYACTSYTDAQIGRVLAALDRLGLRDNTVVVVWGDHGWHLGDHGLWCKHSNFETAVHAPLIFRAPGQAQRGAGTNALSEFVDVYPTLCDVCDLPKPEHLEGLSAMPLLDDPTRPWKKAAFSQYPRRVGMGHSMRTERYRYTRWGRPNEAPAGFELYDHAEDPGENVNLAGLPEHAALMADLGAQLDAGWRGALPS